MKVGDLIAVCMDRTPDLIISLLAVLKCGAAYVPLDPAYPDDRIVHMIDDSRAELVIGQKTLAKHFDGMGLSILALDSTEFNWKELSSSSPNVDIEADELAYVIYTSGSTGKPKGVAIENRSTHALIKWSEFVYTTEQLACVLASTSICFDLSVWEIFVPLCTGGSLLLAKSILTIPVLAQKAKISLINTVPSAIASLIDAKAIPKNIKTVNLAGEPLNQELVDRLYELGSVEKVYDLYGPSEDTTYSTYTLRKKSGIANIGRLISGSKILILDEHKQMMPQGAVGELYLGGCGLARGYLNKPEVSKERFIEVGVDQELYYRTGDLVRMLDDGCLQYIGRTDYQVKVRGFRIELEEIDKRLQDMDKIGQAMTIVDQSGTDKKVISFCVMKTEYLEFIELDFSEKVLAELSAVLPAFMVPEKIILLESLPLTPNGKTDRKALEAMSEKENFLANRKKMS